MVHYSTEELKAFAVVRAQVGGDELQDELDQVFAIPGGGWSRYTDRVAKGNDTAASMGFNEAAVIPASGPGLSAEEKAKVGDVHTDFDFEAAMAAAVERHTPGNTPKGTPRANNAPSSTTPRAPSWTQLKQEVVPRLPLRDYT